MEYHRLPKIALYGEVSTGHCERGSPKKRYKGCLKKPATACYVTIHAGQTWQQTVVASATRSSKRSTSLKKTEETQKKTRESTGKLEPPLSLHRKQLSPVNTAHVLPFLHETCLP